MSDPWRTVAFIEDFTGDHGGEVWMLTLECGHLAFRRKPQMFPYNMMGPRWHRHRKGRARMLLSAPKRCRCIHCGIGTPPNPEHLQMKLATLMEKEKV